MNALARRRRRKLVVARGALRDGEPPHAAVERLGEQGRRGRSALALGGTLGLHALLALVVIAQRRAPLRLPPAPVHREIAASIVRPPPPAPAPPPPPSPPAAHERTSAPRQRAPAAPPPPAQAGKAVAVEGPADLTSFDLVVGQGSAYAGGTSAASGTSAAAVHEPAQAFAPPAQARRAGSDLSRRAAPLRRDWVCDWPQAAQDSELREAHATVRVSISREGAPGRVEVLSAPPGGFAEAAAACASGERYRPALDPAGDPAADSPLFKIDFVR